MARNTYLKGIKSKILQMPGYEPDSDGRGFKLDSPGGKCWFRNISPWDEVFESEFFGTLNVSEIYRKIAGNQLRAAFIPIEPLILNISRREINVRHANSMSNERLKTPIIVAFDSTGIQVLDGAHRIFRRQKQGKKSVKAFHVKSELLKISRVKKYLMANDGEWHAADSLSDEKFDAEILGAKRLEEMFEIMQSPPSRS